MADKLLTVSEAAKVVGIAKNTLYRWINKNQVQVVLMPQGDIKVRQSTAERLRRQRDGEDYSLPEGTLEEIKKTIELCSEDSSHFRDLNS